KVSGEAVYGIDIRLPGMLYAAAKACAVWGGDVKSYDFDRIRNMPGVHSVVRLPFDASTKGVGFLCGGVAVVADSWWRAKTALDALPIDWNYGSGAGVNSASLYDLHLATAKQPGEAKTNDGNVDEAMARAAKVVEAVYSVPFSPRARMEPGNATVLVTDNRVDIWSGDQDPQGLLRKTAKLTGIAPENVYIHSTLECRMDVHVLRSDARQFRRLAKQALRILVSAPDIDAIIGDENRRVARLHAGARREWHRIDCFDDLGRTRHCLVDIPIIGLCLARLFRCGKVKIVKGCGVHAGSRAVIPLDGQSIERGFRSPPRVRHDGDSSAQETNAFG